MVTCDLRYIAMSTKRTIHVARVRGKSSILCPTRARARDFSRGEFARVFHLELRTFIMCLSGIFHRL